MIWRGQIGISKQKRHNGKSSQTFVGEKSKEKFKDLAKWKRYKRNNYKRVLYSPHYLAYQLSES